MQSVKPRHTRAIRRQMGAANRGDVTIFAGIKVAAYRNIERAGITGGGEKGLTLRRKLLEKTSSVTGGTVVG